METDTGMDHLPKPPALRKGIVTRLIGIIVPFAIGVTVVVTGVQLKLEYDRDVIAIKDRFTELVASDVSAIVQNVWLLDIERLDVILQGISHVPDFAYGEVVDESGTVLSSYGDPATTGSISIAHDLEYSHRGNVRNIGEFLVRATTNSAYTRMIDRAVDILVINAFIIFLTAGIIYWAFHHVLTRHMARMASYARSLSTENLDRKLALDRKDPDDGDELTDLVGAIDHMRISLRNSYRDLTRLNEELEERVRLRTRDLSEQMNLFESVFEGVPDAMILAGEDRKIIMCNTATFRVFGYDYDELVGQKTERLYPSNREFLRAGRILWDSAGERTSQPISLSFMRKSGEVFPAEMSVATVYDGDGKTLGIIGIIRDVSERNLLQAQLIQSSKMATLGEMATGVAHELNQPLNIIRMAANNIMRKMKKGETDQDFITDKVERIEKQTERAAHIINHMRSFGRKASSQLEEIDLREIIEGSLDMIGEQLSYAGIEIALDLPETPVVAKGERVQLEQVMLNLLSNARDVLVEKKNPPRQIILSVSKAPKSKNANITVRDTGGGIPEDVLGRVFDPFFTTKDVGQGTGLGLSIVYSLIKGMGGTIDVHNAHGGAEFNIILPAS